MGSMDVMESSYRDMNEDTSSSPITQFYEGSVVFITGSTGFFGKVLVEKLLRSCPGIEKLYLLFRPKKGKSTAERFKEQFSDPIYDLLKSQQPDFTKKIHIVEGDVGILKLGLSDDDYARVTEEVNVFFHAAATVRFDERLRQAVRLNIRGVREALAMASNMSNLSAFIHISTAFSNCVSMEIDEVWYEPPLKPDKLIELVEGMDEEMVHKLTPILLEKFPNTYTFTKMIAETMVKDVSHRLPVAIVRPSIMTLKRLAYTEKTGTCLSCLDDCSTAEKVNSYETYYHLFEKQPFNKLISSVKEPVPGWCDNIYGPTGVTVGASVGLMHSLHCNSNSIADMVPVDYSVNATIAVGYDIGRKHNAPNKEQLIVDDPESKTEKEHEEKKMQIYNYVSSNENPITWGRFMSLVEKHGLLRPTVSAIWCYYFTLHKYKPIHQIYVFFLHTLPAYLVDAVLFCVGKKPMLVKTYQKVQKFSSVISFFSTKEWKFNDDNTRELYKSLTATDKKIFDFDMKSVNWDAYLSNYMYGILKYVIKAPGENTQKGLIRQRILKAIHYSLQAIILYGIYKLTRYVIQLF